MYGYGYYGFDWTYILVLIGAVASLLASAKVNTTFSRFARVRSKTGLTGAQAAREILNQNGLDYVAIEHVSGKLSDHYDPSSQILRLSDSTYGSNSVAAIGVAAHECGHAIQHKEEYGPLKLRSAIVPAANIGSRMGVPIILLGVIFAYNSFLIQLGIWVFSLAVLFQIVTLPVEFDASRRALLLVEDYGILDHQEEQQVKKVLSAAAMTYVAAAAASILQMLRLIILFGGGGRRRD